MAVTLTLNDAGIKNLSAGLSEQAALDGCVTGSIGAMFELRIVIEVSGDVSDWAGMHVYYNPAMFMQSGGGLSRRPSQGWTYQLPASPSGTYVMALTNCGTETANNKNDVVTVDYGGSKITILHTFRVTMDVANYIIGSGHQNRDRLLKSKPTDVNILTNVGPSVFTDTPSSITCWVVGTHADYGAGIIKPVFPFAARFYDSFLNTGPGTAELQTPAFYLTVGGSPATALNLFADTTVRVEWPKDPAWDAGSTCEMFLIDTSNGGNLGGTYLQDYGSGFVTEAVTSDPSFWIAEQVVPYASLIPGHVYRMVVVATAVDTADPSNRISNSFISGPLVAGGLPTPLTLNITGKLGDYNVLPNTDYVHTTVVDHLKSIITVDATTYDGSTATWKDTFENDCKRIRLQVIDTGDSSVVWTREWYKTGSTWNGLVGAYANNIEVSYAGSVMTLKYELPMHFLNTLGDPDFGGKTIQFVWSFICEYPALEWNVSYDYTQAADVDDFKGFTNIIQSIELFDYETGLPLNDLCNSPMVLVRVKLNPAFIGSDTWNLRVYWNREGYGYSDYTSVRPNDGAVEHESYVCPHGEFDQLEDLYNLTSVPATFDVAGVAVFGFDTSDIGVGERVRLYVIAQPVAGPPDPCAGLWPTGTGFPPTEVADIVTSDMQAAVEADPIGYPIGTRLFIIDHGPGIGTPTTNWETATGYVVERTAMGAGTYGDEWIIEAMSGGRVVRVMSAVGTVLEYMVSAAVDDPSAATLYPITGSVGVGYFPKLQAPASYPGVTSVEDAVSPTFALPVLRNPQDGCEFLVVQYTTDPTPYGTWTDSPLMSPVPYDGSGDAWFPGWFGQPKKTFTVDVPPGATYIRAKYMRGGLVQGYSSPTSA